MKVSQISQGAISTLRLRVSGDFPVDCEIEREVRLQFPQHDDGVLFSTPSGVVAVEPCDPDAARQLAAMRATNPPRVCWVVAVQRGGDGAIVTVQVHAFASGLAVVGRRHATLGDGWKSKSLSRLSRPGDLSGLSQLYL